MKRRDFVKCLPILAVTPFILSHTQKEKIHLIAIGTSASRLIERNRDILKVDSITYINDKIPQTLKIPYEFIQFSPPNSAYEYLYGRKFLKSEIPSQLQLPNSIRQRLDNLQGRLILVAGLGKFTGTFMYAAIASYIDSKGFNEQGICTLPFKIEGDFWRKTSIEITNNIHSNQKILDFEKLRKQISNLTILTAFKMADEWVLRELVEALEKS
jgi:hypothetical protein